MRRLKRAILPFAVPAATVALTLLASACGDAYGGDTTAPEDTTQSYRSQQITADRAPRIALNGPPDHHADAPKGEEAARDGG